ncbi:hypothetical protein E8E12_001372 [Didymella heteroderae]|uniref:Uncharacterized protein n=1 Tax=Didymella heteroderae TaxID=1769908 RepID=A0A9P4WG49_9PLEO|nr:hypothetical protein E8E12_001372 [Didymella heteroderae]
MDSHASLLAQLDDSQLDEQVCLTFNAVRQRLFQRNTTIFSIQQNYGRERLDLTRQVQALKHELAVERRKNEKLRTAREGKNNQSPRGEQGCNQECEQVAEQAPEQAPGQAPGQAPEQLSTDRCDTQADIPDTKWQSEQSVEATTLRYRRLGRAALVGSLTVDTQRCTPPPQAVVESVEDVCGSDQRKRAKRSRRKEPPFEVSNNTTASR